MEGQGTRITQKKLWRAIIINILEKIKRQLLIEKKMSPFYDK